MLPLAPLSARELDQIPIIVERLKERVDPAAVTAEISELWTSAAIMAGLRFPWELIKHCFERPIVSMKRGNHPRDPVERRGRQVITPLEGNMAGASKPITVNTKQQRIARPGAWRTLCRPVACS